MTQSCGGVCVNLTSHLLPSSAKGIVLREVTASLWINHTVEYCAIRLDITEHVIIDTIEFRITLIHLFND